MARVSGVGSCADGHVILLSSGMNGQWTSLQQLGTKQAWRFLLLWLQGNNIVGNDSFYTACTNFMYGDAMEQVEFVEQVMDDGMEVSDG